MSRGDAEPEASQRVPTCHTLEIEGASPHGGGLDVSSSAGSGNPMELNRGTVDVVEFTLKGWTAQVKA